jgi:hypothetical protein
VSPNERRWVFFAIYFAGATGGWLILEKYWMAAPMATGAVIRSWPARAPIATRTSETIAFQVD